MVAARSLGKTTFLILSDTHDLDLDLLGSKHPLRQDLPRVDVVLHCGDLTYRTGEANYTKAIRLLGSFKAELRLVIAGNHDVALDASQCPDYEINRYFEAMDSMTGRYAKEHGVMYLTEGVHEFTLKNGTSFTVYATPYTPSLVRRGFSYARDEDRFNTGEIPVGVKSTITAKSIIPDHVDIMMTHGPPKGFLDFVHKKNKHEGCEALYRAVSRVKPLLHCFGHIREGRGVKRVFWNKQAASEVEDLDISNAEEPPSLPEGPCTLMVNAAIKDSFDQPVHGPYLVELQL